MKKGIMTLEEMKSRRKELKYSYLQLSELSGVPYSTVQKVFGGITKSPGYYTIRALAEVLAPEENSYAMNMSRSGALCVQEPQSGYEPGGNGLSEPLRNKEKENVHFKYEKTEWIDRHNCSHMPITAESRKIAARLCCEIGGQLKEKKISAEIVLFPVPVLLGGEEETVFYPDLCIVTENEKIQKAGISGVPDIAVDILPFTIDQEMQSAKLEKYRENHLKEYWTVSRKERNVTVFRMDGNVLTQFYSFKDAIPMHIDGEEFLINFASVVKCSANEEYKEPLLV